MLTAGFIDCSHKLLFKQLAAAYFKCSRTSWVSSQQWWWWTYI